jgi:hypothetical protein
MNGNDSSLIESSIFAFAYADWEQLQQQNMS